MSETAEARIYRVVRRFVVPGKFPGHSWDSIIKYNVLNLLAGLLVEYIAMPEGDEKKLKAYDWHIAFNAYVGPRIKQIVSTVHPDHIKSLSDEQIIDAFFTSSVPMTNLHRF